MDVINPVKRGSDGDSIIADCMTAIPLCAKEKAGIASRCHRAVKGAERKGIYVMMRGGQRDGDIK